MENGRRAQGCWTCKRESSLVLAATSAAAAHHSDIRAYALTFSPQNGKLAVIAVLQPATIACGQDGNV